METVGEKQTSVRLQRLTGVVSSSKGGKTIQVNVDRVVQHPQYGKFLRRRTKLAAHDPQNTAKVGDVVEIVPCRPISKSKSWRLVRVVRQATIQHSVEG
jgi:small subunit ribosomal protein S17